MSAWSKAAPAPSETAVRPVTADELLQMPNDGLRRELVQGHLRTPTPAGHRHGRVAINITAPLDHHVRARQLGVVHAAETGFKLAADPDTVRPPDVAFVRRERVEAVGDAPGYWPGAPDLAVEVVSPGDAFSEVEDKVLDWLSAGARMVIVADPQKSTATVYRSRSEITVLTQQETIDGVDVVPGWTLPVRDIFS